MRSVASWPLAGIFALALGILVLALALAFAILVLALGSLSGVRDRALQLVVLLGRVGLLGSGGLVAAIQNDLANRFQDAVRSP